MFYGLHFVKKSVVCKIYKYYWRPAIRAGCQVLAIYVYFIFNTDEILFKIRTSLLKTVVRIPREKTRFTKRG